MQLKTYVDVWRMRQQLKVREMLLQDYPNDIDTQLRMMRKIRLASFMRDYPIEVLTDKGQNVVAAYIQTSAEFAAIGNTQNKCLWYGVDDFKNPDNVTQHALKAGGTTVNYPEDVIIMFNSNILEYQIDFQTFIYWLADELNDLCGDITVVNNDILYQGKKIAGLASTVNGVNRRVFAHISLRDATEDIEKYCVVDANHVPGFLPVDKETVINKLSYDLMHLEDE